MKNEWRGKMEEEFNAKEADFLARQPKPQETGKANEERKQRERDERHIENQIRMLMEYGNVETAREKEIEFDVKNRMLHDGWDVEGSVSLTLEPDMMKRFMDDLDSRSSRIVILPKDKKAIIFRARRRG